MKSFLRTSLYRFSSGNQVGKSGNAFVDNRSFQKNLEKFDAFVGFRSDEYMLSNQFRNKPLCARPAYGIHIAGVCSYQNAHDAWKPQQEPNGKEELYMFYNPYAHGYLNPRSDNTVWVDEKEFYWKIQICY
jgi:hypothetical protein